MSDFLREELKRAFALDDAAKASFERDEHQSAERSGVQPRPNSFGLIYKTHRPPPMQQQSAPAMDAACEARWNQWCDRRIKRLLEVVMGETVHFINKRLKEDNSKLREEIGVMRAELIKGSLAATLPSFISKRRSDAAA